MWYLIFLYTSFPNSVCQKKVKKNRKFVARVFFKKADIRHEKKYGVHASRLR